MKKWLSMEHQLRKELKAKGILSQLHGKKILIACSGGVDSVALFVFLNRIRLSEKLSLQVLHIHHGIGTNVEFRNQARAHVEKLCQEYKVSLVVKEIQSENRSPESETDLRKKRIQIYQEELKTQQADFLALGHHLDDLLETRLMRLMRGTGGQGLFAMDLLRKRVLRPFLSLTKRDLLEYLSELQVKYCEDPTNQSPFTIRNWLRIQWLEPLRRDHPECLKSMARSFEQIAQELKKKKKHNFSKGISRAKYHAHLANEQIKLLTEYIQYRGVSDFRHSQVIEIQRQLDRAQNRHTFLAAGLVWSVNAQQISAKKK